MSRSKRKPYCTQGFGKPDRSRRFYKKYANKKVRRTKYTIQNNEYKKHFCSWDICDYHYWCGDIEDQKDKFFKRYTRK